MNKCLFAVLVVLLNCVSSPAQQPGYALGTQPESLYRKAMGLLVTDAPNSREHDEALTLLRGAADRRYAPAETALGTLFERGDSSDRDINLALKWYEAAANQGDWIAQLSLGRIYFLGLDGIDRSPSIATKWLRMAAASGDAASAFYLGLLSDEGQDTVIDFREAAKWYRAAAEAGNTLAQERLAMLLLGGAGIHRDTSSAYTWLLVAASFGNHHVEGQLQSIETDLGVNGADAARARAITVRAEVLKKMAGNACNGWPGEFTTTPEPPPLLFQLSCELK